MSKSELVKVDMGQYASRLHKWDLYNDEEYRLDTNKGLKFLHFNSSSNIAKYSKDGFKRWQNRTLAAVALSPDGIRKVATDFLSSNETKVNLLVGVTFVSKNDNYSKQIGRDESVKQIKEHEIAVIGATLTSTHIFIHLATFQGINLHLRLNKKSGFSTVTGQLTGKLP